MTCDVLLLNGWGMTDAAWQPLADALPGRRRLHAMDLCGLHDGGSGGLAQLAAAAAERAPRVCDVVAWSLGAQVALQWMRERPGQVRRATLIAATPCFVAKANWSAGMDPSVFAAFAEDVERDPAAALHRFALLQSRGDANMGAVARLLRAAACSHAAQALPALRAGLACLKHADLRDALPHVRQPVYLAHGSADALVPVAAAAQLRALLPDARMQAFPGAAHALHVSQPAGVAAAIAEFFDEQ